MGAWWGSSSSPFPDSTRFLLSWQNSTPRPPSSFLLKCQASLILFMQRSVFLHPVPPASLCLVSLLESLSLGFHPCCATHPAPLPSRARWMRGPPSGDWVSGRCAGGWCWPPTAQAQNSPEARQLGIRQRHSAVPCVSLLWPYRIDPRFLNRTYLAAVLNVSFQRF